MKKFRVMIVKKNAQPVGVRAAAINGRTIVLARFLQRALVLALRGFDEAR